MYDAGEAMLANFTGPAAVNPYSEADGATWEFYSVTATDGSGRADYVPSYADQNTKGFCFMASDSAASIPFVLVNQKDATVFQNYNLQHGELILHPSADRYSVVRFTCPEDGRYAIHFAAHLLIDNTINADGVDISVKVDDQIVYRTGCHAGTGLWRRDAVWQSGFRFFAKGTKIAFLLGDGDHSTVEYAHWSDGTEVKFRIERADDGEEIYDFTSDFAAAIADGQSRTDFTAANGARWRVNAVTDAAEASEQCEPATRLKSYQRFAGVEGVCNNSESTSPPFVAVNTKPSDLVTTDDGMLGQDETFRNRSASLAAGEVVILPSNDLSPVIRFQPPKAGWYGGRIYLRALDNRFYDGSLNDRIDGVSATVGANRETLVRRQLGFAGTCEAIQLLIEIPPRLMAAGDWIEYVAEPNQDRANDVHAFSATFFREDREVADAGAALRNQFANGAAGDNPWNDGEWTYGYRADINPSGGLTRYTARRENYKSGLAWTWVLDNALPYLTVNQSDALYTEFDAAMMPDELFSHPNVAGASACPAIRWTAKADGIYHIHGAVRDIAQEKNVDPSHSDGASRAFVVAGNVVDMKRVSIDLNKAANTVYAKYAMREYETGDARHVYLRAGEWVESVVSRNTDNWSDGTAHSFVIAPEAAETEDMKRVNIRFGGACALQPRLGWSGERWTVTGSGARLENITIANVDGFSKVSIEPADGCAVRTDLAVSTATDELAAGWLAPQMQREGLWSESPADAKTFTLSGLKPNTGYTLAVYSLPASWRAVQPVFTVNDQTLAPTEKLTSYGIDDAVALYAVTTDGDGRLVCSFAAADDTGAPVNAVQIVGDIRVQRGMMVIVR